MRERSTRDGTVFAAEAHPERVAFAMLQQGGRHLTARRMLGLEVEVYPMILATILSAMCAILSGTVLVRAGSQPVTELATIFLIISSAALLAGVIGLLVDEPKVPRATVARTAIAAEGAAVLTPPVIMALVFASLFSVPFFVFWPVIPAWLHPLKAKHEGGVLRPHHA